MYIFTYTNRYAYMYIHTYTYTHPHTVLLACDCNLLHGHIQGRLADTVLRHSSAGVIPNTPHPTRTADYLLSLACLRTRGVRGTADKGVSRDAVGKSSEENTHTPDRETSASILPSPPLNTQWHEEQQMSAISKIITEIMSDICMV